MKKIIFIAAAFAAMVSCNKSIIESTSVEDSLYGYINLGVNADLEMVVTKGLITEADLSGYMFTLSKNDEVLEGWPKSYEELSDEDWKVQAGSYSIYVENLSVEDAYEELEGVVRVSGETDVTVTAGVAVPCTVDCTPQNSKVSFMYTSDFDTVFDNPSVTVVESPERIVPLAVGNEHLEENCAYFEVGTLEWTLTASIGEDERTYEGEITTQKAKWAQVTFTTGSTAGQINVTVTVDGEITDVQTITATIDPIEGDVDIITE